MIGIPSMTSPGARALGIADFFKTKVRLELIVWLGESTAPFPDDVCPDAQGLKTEDFMKRVIFDVRRTSLNDELWSTCMNSVPSNMLLS